MQKKLLLIDDDPIICKELKKYLEKKGYSLDIAESAEEGLEIITKNYYGLVLLDQNLPGMSGLEALKIIRNKNQGQVIMITGEGDVNIAVEAMKAGAHDFIQKPIKPDLLLTIIKDSLKELANKNRLEAFERQVKTKDEQIQFIGESYPIKRLKELTNGGFTDLISSYSFNNVSCIHPCQSSQTLIVFKQNCFCTFDTRYIVKLC